MTSRRQFISIAVPAAALSLAAGHALAQGAARVDEKDPAAVALGYVHDASRVDTKKFPKYAKGQVCANCSLYMGKATDPWAPCPALANKQVNAKGWCNAWVKKA